MRFATIVILGMVSSAATKTNTKALSESLGQEVIEIAAPVKDLPPELEEEPSGEVDDRASSAATATTATAKDARRATMLEGRRRVMETDKPGTATAQDEEAQVEKELAEMYKDTDYKAESAEVTQKDKLEATAATDKEEIVDKFVDRSGDNFQFEPAGKSKKEVERFRTSVDEIRCAKNKLSAPVTESPSSAGTAAVSNVVLWTLFALI